MRGEQRRVRMTGMALLWASALLVSWPTPADARSPSDTGAKPATGQPSQSPTTGSIQQPKPRSAPVTGRGDKSGEVVVAPRFEPVAFSELPAWADDDHLAALRAFQGSCPQLIAKRSERLGQKRETRIPEALMPVCQKALTLPAKLTAADARAFFEAHFLPHRIGHQAAEGLLTGYFEPLLEGSRKREGRYQAPLLRRPRDAVTLVPETQGAAAGTATHGRRTATGIAPLPSRAEIEAGAFKGQGLELLYLVDAVDVFFLQIQGSGRIKLTDGSIVRVHYDGKNGHPYTSIGRHLIDKGLLAADKMSMEALGAWLKADPARGREAMNQNASYVFFKEMPAGAKGPIGALEIELVAGRSLAIDPGVHRLGLPVYVSAPELKPAGQARPFQRLMIAHDTGAAIKGPERGDIYFGSGEAAGRIAGFVRHPGNLFAFLPLTFGDASGAANGAVTDQRK